MAFDSGRVTFCRLAVEGGSPPARIGDEMLSALEEHRFTESGIGAPDEIEAGFITAEHLLDTHFTYEKIAYGIGGTRAHLAIRIDTHKVPSEVKRAYRVINEQAAASLNPSGFASKGQKKEATELADRQVREELAQGRYRRSKSVPIVWDLERSEVFCGATGTAVIEQVAKVMRRAFGVEVSPISAGVAAGRVLKGVGHSRDYEDLRPSKFTEPPNDARRDEDDAESFDDPTLPRVPWVAKSVDLKDFLGNEWLMWLWWHMEEHGGKIAIEGGEAWVSMDKSLDTDCAWGVSGRQSLRSNDAVGVTRLREAGEALSSGKWPRKAGLILSDGQQQWELSMQADTWVVGACRLPEMPEAQSVREVVEQRLESVSTLAGVLDGLYATFLHKRCGGSWGTTRDLMKRWISDRRLGRANKPVVVMNNASLPRPVSV